MTAFNIPAGWKIERSGQAASVIEVTAPDGIRWCVVAPTDEDDRERKIGAFFHELCAAMFTPPADAVPGEPVALAREVLTAVRAAHPNPEPGSIGAKAIAAITGLDRLAASVASRAGMEPVMWQSRFFDSTSSVTPGWGEWKEVVQRNVYTDTVESKVQELRDYIAAGYKYELRALYAIAPAAPAEAKDAVRAEPECFYVRFAKEWITASERDRGSIREFVEGWYQEDAATPAPTYQQGYDKAISECAALGWKTPADSSGAGRLAVPLTLEERQNLFHGTPSKASEYSLFMAAVDATERAHGITAPAAAEGGQA